MLIKKGMPCRSYLRSPKRYGCCVSSHESSFWQVYSVDSTEAEDQEAAQEPMTILKGNSFLMSIHIMSMMTIVGKASSGYVIPLVATIKTRHLGIQNLWGKNLI
ncbi:MAG: hypothetical protein CM1200mP3_14900 [Chloroflexota bacterium]|nr:MAG: hypothetical protein CM1200mP3_14900 [Chloroflexota bacterium]